jgi:hypothetical protein
MRRKVIAGVAGALLVLGVLPVQADTHAPSLQILDFTCYGEVMTMVSPGFHAKAGQDLGSTTVGVAYMITAGGEVVYESPAVAHMPDTLLTECTAGEFTFFLLLSAQ